MTRKSRAWGSPSRYIQGTGEIRRLPEHTAKYGDRVGAVIDVFFFDSYTKMRFPLVVVPTSAMAIRVYKNGRFNLERIIKENDETAYFDNK